MRSKASRFFSPSGVIRILSRPSDFRPRSSARQSSPALVTRVPPRSSASRASSWRIRLSPASVTPLPFRSSPRSRESPIRCSSPASVKPGLPSDSKRRFVRPRRFARPLSVIPSLLPIRNASSCRIPFNRFNPASVIPGGGQPWPIRSISRRRVSGSSRSRSVSVSASSILSRETHTNVREEVSAEDVLQPLWTRRRRTRR